MCVAIWVPLNKKVVLPDNIHKVSYKRKYYLKHNRNKKKLNKENACHFISRIKRLNHRNLTRVRATNYHNTIIGCNNSKSQEIQT
jgi:hypothetical protein